MEVFLFAVRQEILRVDEFEVPFGAYPQNEQRGDWEVYIRTETYSSAFHSGIERGLGEVRVKETGLYRLEGLDALHNLAQNRFYKLTDAQYELPLL